MTDLTQGDVRALIAEVAELKKQLETRKGQLHGFTNSANLNVNAGGVWLWVAAICCAAMLAALIVLVPVAAVAYTDQQARIRRLDDSDNAIRAYINTGILKPKPEKERAD